MTKCHVGDKFKILVTDLSILVADPPLKSGCGPASYRCHQDLISVINIGLMSPIKIGQLKVTNFVNLSPTFENVTNINFWILDGKQYRHRHQHSIVISSVGCVKVGATLCLMILNLNGILTAVQLKQRKLALQLITQLVTQVRAVLIMGSNYGVPIYLTSLLHHKNTTFDQGARF